MSDANPRAGVDSQGIRMKINLVYVVCLLSSIGVAFLAQAQEAFPLNASPCSSEVIKERLEKMQGAMTIKDSVDAGNVRSLALDKLCSSCLRKAPYDSIVKGLLIQFLKTDKYPEVRAHAAARIGDLDEARYSLDPEIEAALTAAMHQDPDRAVRFRAANSTLTLCHKDTSEVLDTMIAVAKMIPTPSAPENKALCALCPSPVSSLRGIVTAAIGSHIRSGEFRDKRALSALESLSADKDSLVRNTANAELEKVQELQPKGEKYL